MKTGEVFTVTRDSVTAQKTIRRSYLAYQIERLTYHRARRSLKNIGYSALQVNELVGLPTNSTCPLNPSISRKIQRARFKYNVSITDVLQCHVAGLVNENTMIEILTTWKYANPNAFQGIELVDGYPLDNTKRELQAGLVSGLLSSDQFEEIQQGIQAHECGQNATCSGKALKRQHKLESDVRRAYHASRVHKLAFYRAVLCLHHADMPLPDIARLVHVRTATIRSALYSAQQRPSHCNGALEVTVEELLQERAAGLQDTQTTLANLTSRRWCSLEQDLRHSFQQQLLTANEVQYVLEFASRSCANHEPCCLAAP